jgi:hypothetical protein
MAHISPVEAELSAIRLEKIRVILRQSVESRVSWLRHRPLALTLFVHHPVKPVPELLPGPEAIAIPECSRTRRLPTPTPRTISLDHQTTRPCPVAPTPALILKPSTSPSSPHPPHFPALPAPWTSSDPAKLADSRHSAPKWRGGPPIASQPGFMADGWLSSPSPQPSGRDGSPADVILPAKPSCRGPPPERLPGFRRQSSHR